MGNTIDPVDSDDVGNRGSGFTESMNSSSLNSHGPSSSMHQDIHQQVTTVLTNGDSIEMEDEAEGNTSSPMENPSPDFSSFENIDGSTGSSASATARYNWRRYVPSSGTGGGCLRFFRWLVVGGSKFAEPQSDEELNDNLQKLPRCLLLLRKYDRIYGMPTRGDAKDQAFVLREICRDLYGGGAPLWALESVLQRAALGLTGQPDVNRFMLPRKAYLYNPGSDTTAMFSIERGFNMQKMDAMEKVAIRLCTFASNIHAVSGIPARMPKTMEFSTAAHRESVKLRESGIPFASGDFEGETEDDNQNNQHHTNWSHGTNKEEDYQAALAHSILNLASGGRGLFSYVHSPESMAKIDQIDADANRLQQNTRPWLIVACKAVASAGTCAFWFGGSWYDMIVAGILAIVVSAIGTSSVISKQERIVYETVAGALVGLAAGVIALMFPHDTCCAAMVIAAVLDLLQGFRVVYSIIEIMSKHTVSGGADLLEGLLFTTLISFSLRCGLSKGGASSELNSFVSAAAVAFSAGILSRFTGRQAVGNTSSGMYVLVPGADMVSSMFVTGSFTSAFFTSIISQAIAIGIGGWTGTILCSPTVLGTTRGLLWQHKGLKLELQIGGSSRRSKDSRDRRRQSPVSEARGNVADHPSTRLRF
ncbi:pheromone-regulated membrane protein [Seminavis robusta]|uniref:Pheromone-regulated membrane protein n=1 Tax=Seminavis robusta TaxID=568900 RepID=A0A9N8HHS8_9STRA|nr:pheromone-regulated membrane protein [Seminavis robusta]|eukprot:Sro656_g182360.1 pheromone-regulated membrane protein (647) ;mRNA; r:13736-16250